MLQFYILQNNQEDKKKPSKMMFHAHAQDSLRKRIPHIYATRALRANDARGCYITAVITFCCGLSILI